MGHPVVTSGFVGAIGHILDITGAFFLAESFVLKKKKEMVEDARTRMDMNPYLIRSACYRSVEARFGLLFLVLGFVGQFLVYTGAFDIYGDMLTVSKNTSESTTEYGERLIRFMKPYAGNLLP